MKYTPTDVAGVTIIDIEPHRDHRGFFSRSFCADEFAQSWLGFRCRADEYLLQLHPRHGARPAPSGTAVRRGQVGALHPRRDRRRRGRRPARVADLRQARDGAS